LEGKLVGRLKLGELEFGLVGEFLLELKKKFSRGDKESVKVAELKRVEQERRITKEFVQEFRRVARALVEKFKRGMNKVIRKKLIEAERPLTLSSSMNMLLIWIDIRKYVKKKKKD